MYNYKQVSLWQIEGVCSLKDIILREYIFKKKNFYINGAYPYCIKVLMADVNFPKIGVEGMKSFRKK